eukprot:5709987-Prorocentrum_lima.AAC.1
MYGHKKGLLDDPPGNFEFTVHRELSGVTTLVVHNHAAFCQRTEAGCQAFEDQNPVVHTEPD